MHFCITQKLLKDSPYFQVFFGYSTKNTWKHLKFVLKNNLFSKQILKISILNKKNFEICFWVRKLFYALKNKKAIFISNSQRGPKILVLLWMNILIINNNGKYWEDMETLWNINSIIRV